MKRNLILALAVAALAIAPMAFAATSATGNSTLGVIMGPEASFTSIDQTTTLNKLATGDTLFGSYGGTTNFVYKIRTTLAGGTGTITLLVGNFTTTGGGTAVPVISDLLYTCSAITSGATPCTGSIMPTGTAGTVVAFGADTHSANTGDAGTNVWTLADRTTVDTGSYTSIAVYTIAAL